MKKTIVVRVSEFAEKLKIKLKLSPEKLLNFQLTITSAYIKGHYDFIIPFDFGKNLYEYHNLVNRENEIFGVEEKRKVIQTEIISPLEKELIGSFSQINFNQITDENNYLIKISK